MTTSMKTPLGKVRGLGSAKSGTEHFWRQRLTGVALVPLTIIFVLALIGLARADAATALARLRSPWLGLPLLLFVGAGAYHMRLGMQVIIEDYVTDETLKLAAVMANAFFCVLIGVLCAYALLKLNFGV
ncbi:succinate dehydrogenase, hydrophobic membrane anchor protein [Labrys wisconsinensis]|uniref:Succinate dehydrogenase hydrophobic membrane anchor subunit n=1 Tax=Labrys wisconsinensis TaxID=425677 RepID=A0ABU0J464_9HYPH|nr:succinate dehydrogenase, hydrophobic membrane anchor protein [Labrys wisconsinensis]MDQ0468208.1 succinate dehydrogenase / fumarate reductase membrane anchor subunit [Labrys wisconsinensis]